LALKNTKNYPETLGN